MNGVSSKSAFMCVNGFDKKNRGEFRKTSPLFLALFLFTMRQVPLVGWRMNRESKA